MNTPDSGRFGAPQPLPRADTGHATAAATADDCEKVASVLDKVAAGDASPEEVEYLLASAEDCSPCFDSIEKQRLFVSFLKGNLRQHGVPADLAAAIRQRIQQEEAVG